MFPFYRPRIPQKTLNNIKNQLNITAKYSILVARPGQFAHSMLIGCAWERKICEEKNVRSPDFLSNR